VVEAITSFPEQSFVPNAFRYLSFFQTKRPNKRVLELCLTKVQQLYWSFTQRELLPSHPVDFQALGPICAHTTTDIVSCSPEALDTLLDPLQFCFAFFATSPSVMSGPLLGPLVHLLPYEVLQLAAKDHVRVEPAQVELILNHARAPAILALCVDFFAQAPSPAVDAVINDMIDDRDRPIVTTSEFAFSIVRYFALQAVEMGREAASRLLNILPEPEQRALAVRLFAFPELEFADRLLPGFPFLRFESDPEAARQWFIDHSIAEWPLRADPVYGTKVLRLMKAGPGKLPVDGLDKVDLSRWLLILRNP
jgi:hypothetical protein